MYCTNQELRIVPNIASKYANCINKLEIMHPTLTTVGPRVSLAGVIQLGCFSWLNPFVGKTRCLLVKTSFKNDGYKSRKKSTQQKNEKSR